MSIVLYVFSGRNASFTIKSPAIQVRMRQKTHSILCTLTGDICWCIIVGMKARKGEK
jgi:hypothetical protein